MTAERSSERLHLPSVLPVVTGMPELCRAGLSENWLLKACGHRHWMALAEAHGLTVPEFRDAGGFRLYPAFTFIRLADARLETVGEHRTVDFDVTLRRASRTRFRSQITVRCDGDVIAEVAMETVFVRRSVAGVNTSACRSVVGGPCLLIPQRLDRLAPPRENWAEGPELSSITLDPSPNEDFNGVGFLYFAAFQAMADRALWSLSRQLGHCVTREREISFFGNAELGERIVVTVIAQEWQGADHRLTVVLRRQSDEVAIAAISTRLAINSIPDRFERLDARLDGIPIARTESSYERLDQ